MYTLNDRYVSNITLTKETEFGTAGIKAAAVLFPLSPVPTPTKKIMSPKILGKFHVSHNVIKFS